jgi:hypothetical protein
VQWRDAKSVGRTARVEHGVAQLNHYFVRSREDWNRKRARGHRGPAGFETVRAGDQFAAYDRNELYDGGALRFAPAVRRIMDAAGYDPQAGAALTWAAAA